MRRTNRSEATAPAAVRTVLTGALLTLTLLLTSAVFLPSASAQSVDEIVQELEADGYFIGPGALGSVSGFEALVTKADQSAQNWYFVSLDSFVDDDFADLIRDQVQPTGNVLVYFLDGDFEEVQLATGESESVELGSLTSFDEDFWTEPEEFMTEVIDEFAALTSASSSGSSGNGGTTTTTTATEPQSDSGGGFPWGWVAVPAVVGGGFWFMSRRGKQKQAEEDLEQAEKIRTELQSELDELANDVLVLSSPVDLGNSDQATTYYREATDTYLEMPEPEKLAEAQPKELAELGARVAHARWQMDAAEALINGEPVPEKPKVEPPAPAPSAVTAEQKAARQARLPQRRARPRVQYSPSRRRSGGGLLDILIAGSGMLGGGRRRGRRRSGGAFGGGFNSRNTRSSRSSTRRSGGVFGSGSSRSSGSSRRSGGVFGRSSRSSSSSSSRSRSSSSRRRSRSRSSSSRRSRASSSRRSSSSRRRRR